MRENLLGYLLGALDAAEQETVEQQLESDPRLQRDLDTLGASLAPLESSRVEFEPPDGLAEETCGLVAREQAKAAVVPASASSRGNWTLADFVVAGGVVAAAALLFFPAIINSQIQEHITQCKANLRNIGIGLVQYSEANHGSFPYIPTEGNLSAAGVYAPMLVDGTYVSQAKVFFCPSSPRKGDLEDSQVPCIKDIRAAHGEMLARLRRMAGGSYGYNLGYMDGDRHRATINRGRTHFALVSDAPSMHLTGRQSGNHGGRGQNVLFENGSVKYLVTCLQNDCGDDVFLSERGYVEAGTHKNDAVIGHSASPPVLWGSNRGPR